jgi:hypothetical protein
MNNVQGAVGGQNVNHTGVTADAVTSYTQNKYPILTRYHGGQHPLAKEASNTKLEPLPETRAAFVKALTAEMTGNGQGTLDPHTVKKYQDKMVLEGLGENVDLMYAREFQRWLRGVSVFNEPRLTPWGHRNMFHVPGVTEYLRELIQLRFDYQQSLMHLYMQPPQSLFDLELYYKYIVLQFGLVIPRNDGVRDPATTMSGTDPRSFMSISGMLYFLDDYQMTSFVSRDLPLTDQALVDAGDRHVDALAPSLTRDHGTLDSVVLGTGPVPPAPNGQPLTTAPTAPAPVAPNPIAALVHQLEQDRLQQAALLKQLTDAEARRIAEFERERLHLQSQHQQTVDQLATAHTAQMQKLRADMAALQAEIENQPVVGTGTPDAVAAAAAAKTKQLQAQMDELQRLTAERENAAKLATESAERKHWAEMQDITRQNALAQEDQKKKTKALKTKLVALERENAAAKAREALTTQRLDAQTILLQAVTAKRAAEQEREFATRINEAQATMTAEFLKSLGSVSGDFKKAVEEQGKTLDELVKSAAGYKTMEDLMQTNADLQKHYGEGSMYFLNEIKEGLLKQIGIAEEESKRQLEAANLAKEAKNLTQAQLNAAIEEALLAQRRHDALKGAMEEQTRVIQGLKLPDAPPLTKAEAIVVESVNTALKQEMEIIDVDAMDVAIKDEMIKNEPEDRREQGRREVASVLQGSGVDPAEVIRFYERSWIQRADVITNLHRHLDNVPKEALPTYRAELLQFETDAIAALNMDLDQAYLTNHPSQYGEYRNAAHAMFLAILHNEDLYASSYVDANGDRPYHWVLRQVNEFLHKMYINGGEIALPVMGMLERTRAVGDATVPEIIRAIDRSFGVAQAAAWYDTSMEDQAAAMELEDTDLAFRDLANLFQEYDVSTARPMDLEGAEATRNMHFGQLATALQPSPDSTAENRAIIVGHADTAFRSVIADPATLANIPTVSANADEIAGYEFAGRDYATELIGALVTTLRDTRARPSQIMAEVSTMVYHQFGEHVADTRPLVEHMLASSDARPPEDYAQVRRFGAVAAGARAVAQVIASVFNSFTKDVDNNNMTDEQMRFPESVILQLRETLAEADANVVTLDKHLYDIRRALMKQVVLTRPPDPRQLDGTQLAGAAMLQLGIVDADEIEYLITRPIPRTVTASIDLTDEARNATQTEFRKDTERDIRVLSNAATKGNMDIGTIIEDNNTPPARMLKAIFNGLAETAPLVSSESIETLKVATRRLMAEAFGGKPVPIEETPPAAIALSAEFVDLGKLQPILTDKFTADLQRAIGRGEPLPQKQREYILQEINTVQKDLRPTSKTFALIDHWRKVINQLAMDSNVRVKEEPRPKEYVQNVRADRARAKPKARTANS